MSTNPLNDISKVYLEQVIESAVPGKPAEKLGAVTAIPKSERDAARERALAKAKAMREKKGIKKESLDPVGHEDADVDNDGKKNTNSDKYLLKRRKAIGKAISTKEEKEVKRWWDDDGDGKGYEKGEVSGKFKKKKSVKEGFSNWRQDLLEVMDVSDKEENEEKITEKKVKNKIKINPNMGEAVENLGGVLLEMEELDEKAYRGLGVGRVERVSSGSYQAPETTGAAAKRKKVEKPKPVVAKKVEKTEPKEEGRRARRRRKGSPSYAEIKAGIESREKSKKKKKKVTGSNRLDDLLASIRSEGLFDGSITRTPSKIQSPQSSPIKRTPSKIQSGPKINQTNSYELEGNQLDEKTLNKNEMKKREEIVKSMKDKMGDFEKRYPGRGKEVMYATATKIAKKTA